MRGFLPIIGNDPLEKGDRRSKMTPSLLLALLLRKISQSIRGSFLIIRNDPLEKAKKRGRMRLGTKNSNTF